MPLPTTPLLRALLADAVDYAGLYPPASLPLERAVAAYAGYRGGADAWALGRFVVAAARLGEFADAAASLLPDHGNSAWRLSALAGDDLAGDLAAVARFNADHAHAPRGAARVDAVELRAAAPDAIRAAAGELPEALAAYVELPLGDGVELLVDTVREVGLRAKVRTGAVTPDGIPSAAAVARFLVACARAGVACKATAGLHHPLRGSYPLTYAPDAPRAPLFGFLNVLLGAAVARAGGDAPDVAALLAADEAGELRITDDAIVWRGHEVGSDALRALRVDGLVSFGSCSFTEPTTELAALLSR